MVLSPDLRKAQRTVLPQLQPTSNNTVSILRTLFGHCGTEGREKHFTFFLFLIKKIILLPLKLISNKSGHLLTWYTWKQQPPKPWHQWFCINWCFQRKTDNEIVFLKSHLTDIGLLSVKHVSTYGQCLCAAHLAYFPEGSRTESIPACLQWHQQGIRHARKQIPH